MNDPLYKEMTDLIKETGVLNKYMLAEMMRVVPERVDKMLDKHKKEKGRRIDDLPLRGSDGFGYGHFGAPRSNGRTHNGTDFSCNPGDLILSPISGKITKKGVPHYNEAYRYIQITDSAGLRHRVFYVQIIHDLFEMNAEVFEGDPIGVAQNISKKYDTDNRKMINHIHYEIINTKGEPINPLDFLDSLK